MKIMKKGKKVFALLSTLSLVFVLAACGGGEEHQEKDVLVEKEALADPSIVIELGDLDGINELGSKMQNFEIDEGTVIKITGIVSRDFDTPSIMEKGDGEKNGISMFLDDMSKEEYPEANAVVEAIGIAQKGEYYMEFHVLKENLKVLPDAQAEDQAESATKADTNYGKTTGDATGYVDRDTLKAAVVWCKEQYSGEVKPTYEEVREQFGGVDGKKYENGWDDTTHLYMWKVEGAPNGKDYILVTFTVASDGTEILKQDQYDSNLAEASE